MYREVKERGTVGFPFETYLNFCNNGLSLFTHYHSEFEIIYIYSGDGIAYIDNESYYVSDGDILFVNSEQLHGIIKNSERKGKFTSVVFAPEFFGNMDKVIESYVSPIINRTVKIPTLIKNNKELQDCIIQLSEQKNLELFHLRIKSLMFKIWEILISEASYISSNANNTKLDEIKIAINYMKNNYSQKITLTMLSQLTNMSKVYFCRKFTNATGVTPIQYLMQTRIEKSCDLLKNTDMGIGNIAMTCGFSSFSYYSEAFKKIIGCTPQNYRHKTTNL